MHVSAFTPHQCSFVYMHYIYMIEVLRIQSLLLFIYIYIYFIFFLSQFLLLILGFKEATSDYACIWCKIHKLLRYQLIDYCLNNLTTYLFLYIMWVVILILDGIYLSQWISGKHMSVVHLKTSKIVLQRIFSLADIGHCLKLNWKM